MPWFDVDFGGRMQIEAKDAEAALRKGETILSKRVVGQSFGSRKNDRGEVVEATVDVVNDVEPPDTDCCPDCGDPGEMRGHMECRSPQDIPDDSGLVDPMETER
jgi:hypothetical protein